MPPAAHKTATARLTLIFGQEFLVQQRAKELVHSLAAAVGDFGLETIEGTVGNAAEAVAILARVTEALNTPPFLGGEKIVWLKDANFLGTDRTSAAQDVVAALTDLTDLLKGGLPAGVTFVVSAAAVDKRRGFFTAFQKLGQVIAFESPDERSREAQAQLAEFIDAKLRAAKKSLDDEARERLLALVTADLRQLDNELDKLITYVGPRRDITAADIAAIVTATRGALVWDLTDAFGERNLPQAIATLEDLLHRGENAIGLLFALINKTRALLLLRDLRDRKVIQAPSHYHAPALASLAKEAAAELPSERTFNPLMQHPFALFKNLQHAGKYTTAELIAAQTLWLSTNERLVSSALDEKLLLQQALTKVMQRHNAIPL